MCFATTIQRYRLGASHIASVCTQEIAALARIKVLKSQMSLWTVSLRHHIQHDCLPDRFGTAHGCELS